MGTEIERKFLVRLDRWRPSSGGTHFVQGYLSSTKERVVRVRIEGDQARLTIKGITVAMTRMEFEYVIPLEDARVLLHDLCERPLIDKHRHRETHGTHTWEVDVFHADNEGLVVAEVELKAESDLLDLPAWVGEEVTGDPRYFNSNLLTHPFSSWDK
jgi:CYTH domain-containing protein